MNEYTNQYEEARVAADRMSTSAANQSMGEDHCESAAILAAAAQAQATLALAAATMAAAERE